MNDLWPRLYRHQLPLLTVSLFKHTLRQPAVLFWGIIFPILMTLGLGIAFTQKKHVVHEIAVISHPPQSGAAEPNPSPLDTFLNRYAVTDDNASEGRMRYTLVAPDSRLGDTTFVFLKTDWQRAMALLKRGHLSLILEERDGHITYHFDPLKIDAQLIYYKLSNLLKRKTPVAGNPDHIAPLKLVGTRYIDFLVPGLIAMGIMMSIMWGMSYSTIEKRSKMLLRRMVATPMKKSYFLLALMIVRIAMNVIEGGLLYIFAYFVFDIRIQGSLPALIAVFLAGNLAFGGLAVFVSSRVDNTEIGNGLINAMVIPMMVLSGIFFSYQNFPAWSLPFIEKLPLALLADGLRAIFIEAAGFSATVMPCIYLLGIGILFFITGLKIFKWY